MPTEGRRYILLDEVTYIAGWDKGIKYLADAGLLEGVVLIATGSDMAVIQEARMRFPGRRGQAAAVDFHLHPLSFAATVGLKRSLSSQELLQLAQPQSPLPQETEQVLLEEFLAYLVHGGFLTAINDMARHDRILPATFATYSDWIRGDVLKRGKQEHYLSEVLAAIVRCCGTQTTYNALARDLSIDHPATVSDYIALLTSMDVLRVQPALREDKLTAAPKKARKISFCDPFIFHAVQSWLHELRPEPSRRAQDPFTSQVRPLLADPERTGPLVEACAVAHYGRRYPTYYIKGAGEVDIAYIKDGRFWPVEIKWTSQLRPKTLKQISKYANSRILARRSAPAKHRRYSRRVPTPDPIAARPRDTDLIERSSSFLVLLLLILLVLLLQFAANDTRIFSDAVAAGEAREDFEAGRSLNAEGQFHLGESTQGQV